jgi:putative endonuclease
MNHYCYLVECKDKSLYCGYTIDLKKRIYSHNFTTKGAKYTRNKRPVKLVYYEVFETKKDALKREREIKKYTKSQKLKLINEADIEFLMAL